MSRKPSILLTGSSGMLGATIALGLCQKYDLYLLSKTRKMHNDKWNYIQCDLTKEDAVTDVLSNVKPDIVINAAALSTIAECNQSSLATQEINVRIPRELAQQSKLRNIIFIHLSTDQVYDGSKCFVTEIDAHPINSYGTSKLQGEFAVLSENENAIVLRLALVYGLGQGGKLPFSHWLVNHIKSGKEANLFNDEYRTPLFIEDLPLLMLRIISRPTSVLGGIYNVGCHDRVSRYEFACRLADVFKLDVAKINSVSIEVVEVNSVRPKDCSMDISKICSSTDWKPTDIGAGLLKMKNQFDANYRL